MQIRAMNFKPYERGAMRGFLDLGYGGLTIKGCRLMYGSNGLWLALPQKKGEQDGVAKYYDIMFMTRPEAEHVRRVVIADLQAQGHIEGGQAPQPTTRKASPKADDLGEYYPGGDAGDDDDIPF